MRKCFLTLVALLVFGSACYPAVGTLGGRQPSVARVQKNLVTNYGATCNGVADDTTAFVAFKAEFQGTTPVTLTLPGVCTYSSATAGNIFVFKGISDLVVAGLGESTSSLKLLGTSNFLLGGSGQFQNNRNSLRTNDANAGDSCIIAKTSPAFTVTGVANTIPIPAQLTAGIALSGTYVGTQSGTNLTVSSISSGTVEIGAVLQGTGIASGTFIVSQTSGTPNGTGVYVTSLSGTASVATITASGAVLNVTAVASGTIAVGAYVKNSNSTIAGFTKITSQLTGSAGSTGTYQLNTYQPFVMASQTFTTAAASFTASATSLGIMTVTAVADGTITPGMYVYSDNGQVRNPQTVKPYGTGGTTGVGGTGTYKLDVPPSSNVTSRGFQGNGQIRMGLNSTAGMTTGDTLFFTGVTGQGVLPQRIDGLRWVKVIDGTHVDIFQSDFDGSYISGGSGGGDRTSLMPTGSKVMMTGWSNQAYWSSPYAYPSNPHWFEYKTVTSTNSTTHQICFDTPLAYSYKAAWPQMNTGNQFEVDPGGPATLYVLDPSWELVHEYRDLTIDNPSNQTTANGRTVTFRNVTMTGSNCVIPTQNETHNWINITATNCQIETDKLVVNWNLTNVALRKVDVQSSSMVNINVNGLTATNGWFGSGKKLNMQNATVTGSSLAFGITAYGASEESICSNCSAAVGVAYVSSNDQVDFSSTPWSMSGGTITVPNAFSFNGNYEYQIRNLIPGTYVMWQGGGGGGTTGQNFRYFKITGASQDFDNAYFTTTEAGGFPTGGYTTNGLWVVPHPAPKLTTSGMSGSNTALSFNGCPAQSPMYSCQNFTYTGGAAGTTAGFLLTLWGELDTFTFTNNVPYTGAGTLTWKLSGFDNWNVIKTDLTQVDYGASPNGQNILNTKLPSSCGSCTRTLTSSGATNTQVGDTITVPPAGAWFGGQSRSGPVFSANTPSDSPQVTVTLRTNQNLPP